MKNNKILILCCLIPLFLTGCASVNVKKNLVTLNQGQFFENHENVALSSVDNNTKLKAAYAQVTGRSTNRLKTREGSAETENNDTEYPLPSYLANEPLIRKITVAAYQAIAEDNNNNSSLEITKGDISSMTEMLNHNFNTSLANGPMKATVTAEDASKETHIRLLNYLVAYYSNGEKGFINREGTVYKRPDIKYSIGNDVITAVVAITLESLFDSLLHTPVYFDVDKENKKILWQTIGGARPTFDEYTNKDGDNKPIRFRVPIVEVGEEGIDKKDLKLIRYLSGLASDQSKMLSGAAYRAIGGLDIGFVLLGKFSFGDNDTLAQILDTSFEVASKRIVEEVAYQGFRRPARNQGVMTSERPSKAEVLLQALD
ncbi:hypothetical protein SAMN05216299_1264 [Nitrosospira sp. Nsp14]|uniref:hypothetical protein n=1 Tax=Nitrosospira sp. Nsp14 TaxID=1855333 RepID=UPI0008E4D676|nr:hypothetical protein [Nitrosospira sp. Nsp14]SFH58194.1 hypothetical protein SAMN05216299_1264 [Nitrosospira sp. Nsp14]